MPARFVPIDHDTPMLLPPDLRGLGSLGWAINISGLVVAAVVIAYEWQKKPKNSAVSRPATQGS